jgi:predicted ATP-grasp superfamily ATP-dependent carboligase
VRKVPIDAYPHGLLDALAHAPQAPVIYTGALENRPDLIAKIDRPLWGNPPDVLHAVRSPERWTRCLLESGLPCPAISTEPTDVGLWLLKPRKSAGGFGIHAHDGQLFEARSHFLQEWIDGQPCSAVFLGTGGQVSLLGVTQQLIGTPWLNASGFHYAGSIGPLPLDPTTEERWRRLGHVLGQAFSLQGLFGVDAIVRDGVPWPVEINPRYTASVEILERGQGVSALAMHRDAVTADIRSHTLTPGLSPGGRGEQGVWGKAILFARRTFDFPADGPWLAALEPGVGVDQVEFADIPHAGEIIDQGRPVLTLFASAPTVAECAVKLQEKAQALDRRLWG